ncbi:hypothetical protein D3C84_819810 [compost metagenome]
MPIQPDRRLEQTITAHNALAFVPEQLAVAADVQLRLEMPEIETLAAGRAPQRHYIPIEQPRITLQVNGGAELGPGIAEDDRLLRQPFQCRAGGHFQVEFLISRPFRAIPLGRAGAGDLRPRRAADAGADVQPVTTGNSAWRMHDDVLAHLGPFGIQVLLHPQRAFVPSLNRARAVAESGVAQLQFGMPARGKQGSGKR